MVAIRPQDADRVLARPDPAVRVVLLHGTDSGLISERAANFCKTVLGGADEAFGLVRLEAAEIASDPGRLADEANTIPLFGGSRVIRVRVSGNRPILNAVTAVLAAPPRDSWVVLEAGEIRKGVGLRKLCEAAPGAAAIACYADEGAALDRLIESELSAFRLTPEARTLLKLQLGADRLASRSELVKLALYARGRTEIDVADIRAVIGDGGGFAADEAVDAAAAGDAETFDRHFRRIIASGTPAFVVASSALRHFQTLHKIRSAIEAGAPQQAAIDMAGGVFFQRKAKLEQAVRLWSSERLLAALDRLDRAILDSRLKAAIGEEIIGQALLSIAVMARQARRPAA
ncbi:MAG: DNA polymerase III subunit delta [Rhizobiales bacterium]|nr:DNA polymerase III subunit delta [Hyphomicrobiales bacterium]